LLIMLAEEYGRSGRIRTQDVVFVVEEKEHDRFKRDGDDIVCSINVSLLDALTGPADPSTARRTIQTLDKRAVSYTIPFPSSSGGAPLQPGQEIRIKGEGMPKKAGQKGDLVVKVNVVFPPRISASQASAVRAALQGN
jgi:DnaJ family protein B protein 4